MFIAGNWKMNTDALSAVELAQGVVQQSRDAKGVRVAVCPPGPLLSTVGAVLAGSRVHLGAQNMYWADSGAFTGEVSAQMLISVGCHYVIFGALGAAAAFRGNGCRGKQQGSAGSQERFDPHHMCRGAAERAQGRQGAGGCGDTSQACPGRIAGSDSKRSRDRI